MKPHATGIPNAIPVIPNAARRCQTLFANQVNAVPTYRCNQQSSSSSNDYGEAYPIEEADEYIEDWTNDIEDPDRIEMIRDASIFR